MSSASCLTSRLRTTVEASLTKAVYPQNKVINSNPLYATIGCSPSFVPLSYSILLCGKVHPAKICIGKV